MDRRQQEIIETIISKAWEDTGFKKELIVNPVVAIERLTGVKVVLPEGKSLEVVDQTDKSKIYVNIPAEPELEKLELTEDQLEAVAGGEQQIWDGLVKSMFSTWKEFIPAYK